MNRTLLFIALFFGASLATYGVDMSQDECGNTALSDWTCIQQNGIDFAIVEAWDGGYDVNQNINSCVSNAWQAGMAHVDIYVFLCPNCGGNNPPDQALSTLVNDLQSQNVQFGMIWIDVEQCSGCWNDEASNCQFVQDTVSAAENLGLNAGIYSSDGEWGQTVGTDCTALSDYPLWYAHYDGDASFDDTWAYEFGGWTKPAIKQYQDTGPCVNVDSDWYPDSHESIVNASIAAREKRMLKKKNL